MVAGKELVWDVADSAVCPRLNFTHSVSPRDSKRRGRDLERETGPEQERERDLEKNRGRETWRGREQTRASERERAREQAREFGDLERAFDLGACRNRHIFLGQTFEIVFFCLDLFTK